MHENNGLTIGEQKNAIQNFYNPLLTEFRDMLCSNQSEPNRWLIGSKSVQILLKEVRWANRR